MSGAAHELAEAGIGRARKAHDDPAGDEGAGNIAGDLMHIADVFRRHIGERETAGEPPVKIRTSGSQTRIVPDGVEDAEGIAQSSVFRSTATKVFGSK